MLKAALHSKTYRLYRLLTGFSGKFQDMLSRFEDTATRLMWCIGCTAPAEQPASDQSGHLDAEPVELLVAGFGTRCEAGLERALVQILADENHNALANLENNGLFLAGSENESRNDQQPGHLTHCFPNTNDPKMFSLIQT